MTLARRTDQIAPFYGFQVISQIEQLEREGVDVIRLFIGEPDFGTPEKVTLAAQQALKTQPQGYTPTAGLPELRASIAKRYQRWHNLDIDPQRIIVTPGGSIALQLALLATLNEGDEVILPQPGYPCYANLLPMLNAKAKPLHLDEDDQLSLNMDALSKTISPSTRALLMSSPSNPLGSVMSLADWKRVCDLCQPQGVHVLADEIYHGITFEGPAPSVLEVSNEAWVIQSFSKFYGMTGWRLGWLVVPEYAVDACFRLAQNMYLSSSAIAQQAAVTCFTDEVEQTCFARVAEFRQRRDFLMQALPTLGLPVVANPDGAFYVYVDVSNFSKDAMQFCADVLSQAGVALSPGIDFGGPNPKTSIRIAYTVSLARLEQAIERLKTFLASYSVC